MRNKVNYEWCYESIDMNSDIDEVDFEDRLINFQDNRKTDTLCLIRREGNEEDGEIDRVYAYVKNGELPNCFEDGTGSEYPSFLVPDKYKVELKKHLTAL